jgi:general secretion pathway protein D
MNNKQIIVSILIGLACMLPLSLNSARRTRRHSSIIQALQEPIENKYGPNDPFVSAPMQIAKLESPTLPFDKESTKEISISSIEDPEGTLASSDGQLASYELPRELQQEAERELAKVEEKAFDMEKIELQFENADLQNLVQQIAELFQVTFISDDAIVPLPKGTSDSPTKALKGNKISFKTTTPLTRQQAWDVFITFMNVSGFTIVRQADPTIYRIETIKASQRAPLPTFIGVEYETLPDNDEMIRYLYFLENASIDTMKGIIPSLQSKDAAPPLLLQEHKAIILTDKSYNIKALMKIVTELDQVTHPQAMSILKLKQADAVEVKKLYDELTQQGEEDRSAFRPFGARKQPMAIYFPENARIIAEPRTNSLILLGSKDAINKIEEFIIKHVDVDLEQPYSPLYTYQLQYADAKVIAQIMNETTKLGHETEAGKTGGVRGQDKYLREMNFTAEPSTNQLIIKGDYNDYLVAKEIIQQLDEPQPQVAIEVLILSVELKDDKELGVQLRSKYPGLDGILGKNVEFQTSGLRAGGAPSQVVTNPTGPGSTRLLGNLLKLVTNAVPGNTIVTFGQDIFGVWGLFQALQIVTNLQVISNPFLVASNKTPATVSLGETRRVTSGTITAGGTTPTEDLKTNDTAELKVNITPQINSDGMIILKLRVELGEFTNPDDESSGNKTQKIIETQALVADREVLALGGLIKNTTKATLSKTPILGDIPILGWLFKNKSRSIDKTSLLILISTKIIPAHATSEVNLFTQDRLEKYRDASGDFEVMDRHDPIHKLFFTERADRKDDLSEFIFERHQRTRRKNRIHKRAQEKKQAKQRRGLKRKKSVPPADNKSIPTGPSQKEPNSPMIATPPSTSQEQKTALSSKKRHSRSLSSFLSPSAREKLV